jgi:uncharacterized protein (DUF2062 family)
MEKEKLKLPLTWIFLRMRPVFRWIIRLRGSPQAIAGGFSLGLFIAFTPTIGVQIFLAFFLATVLNLNRPAAVLVVWITNPLTIPAIFSLNYWLGSLIWEGPSVQVVSRRLFELASQLTTLDFWAITEQLSAVAELGVDVIVPLILGSIIAGTLSATLSYVILLRLFTFLFVHRAMRKKVKDDRARSDTKNKIR